MNWWCTCNTCKVKDCSMRNNNVFGCTGYKSTPKITNGDNMTIDTDELIEYIEKPCVDCKDKDTNWCERCCQVTNTLDTIESFIDTKCNSPK